MLSACLLTKNAFYLLNYVSWPLSVDTSSIWPQMRPFSSYILFSEHFVLSSRQACLLVEHWLFSRATCFYCVFISSPSNKYSFGVLRRFQHCTGHITTGSWKGRGNQYIQFVRVLYCKLPTNGKQLPAFPLEAVPGIEPQPQRWEARVLPLCHRGPPQAIKSSRELYCVYMLCCS